MKIHANQNREIIRFVENVAVGNVSWASATEMLLRHWFREHRLEKCCRGECCVDIDFENVAVACVSWVSICNILYCCGSRSGRGTHGRLSFRVSLASILTIVASASNTPESPYCWPAKHESERPRSSDSAKFAAGGPP